MNTLHSHDMVDLFSSILALCKQLQNSIRTVKQLYEEAAEMVIVRDREATTHERERRSTSHQLLAAAEPAKLVHLGFINEIKHHNRSSVA